MARRRDDQEVIEQWFCHAPAADVQVMLTGLRLICRARGDIVWPEPTNTGKRTRRKKSANSPENRELELMG